MVKAQEWLDKNYPKEQRKTVKRINVDGKNLVGVLDLSDFSSLEHLNCARNLLQDLILPSSATDCLNHLDIYSNNFPEQDLSRFSSLVNLQILYVGNDISRRENISRGIYNHFAGSLKFLQNLTKLEKLGIANTDIDKGLEYLPESIKEVACSADTKRDAKVKIICDLLEFGGLKAWVDNFPQRIQGYKKWRKLNFTEEEIKKWVDNGLTISELDFVILLKEKGYDPNSAELKNNKAQLWLEFNYPKGLEEETFKKLHFIFNNNNETKDNKLLAANEIVFNFPLKKIPSEYWDKAEVDSDWDKEYSMPLPNKVKLPAMIDWSGSAGEPGYDKRFKTQKLLDGFKKYTDGEADFYFWAGITSFRPKIKDIPSDYFGDGDNWNQFHSVSYFPNEKKLTQYLREANKIFHNPAGYGQVTSQEAFEFLQSMIESQEIKVTVKFKKDDELDLRDWTVTELDISNKNLTGELNLQYFPNLKILNCENNNFLSIDGGLECLPESLETIYCTGSLAEGLKDYYKKDNEYNYRAWRRNYENQQQIQQLELEKAKIPTFEKEIFRLTTLIKQQKDKVVKAYLFFFSETEQPLIKELIEAHLELTRAKKQRLDSLDYEDKCYEIKREIRKQFGKEVAEKAQLVLADCEELIHYEAELAREIKQNQQMLEETKRQINYYITYFNAPININQGNLLIGSVLGDNANLSHTTQITELTEQFSAHTLQPPEPN